MATLTDLIEADGGPASLAMPLSMILTLARRRADHRFQLDRSGGEVRFHRGWTRPEKETDGEGQKGPK